MSSIRAYIKGENEIPPTGSSSMGKLRLESGRELTTFHDEGGIYVHLNYHGYEVVVPAELKGQIIRVTVQEKITDPVIFQTLPRGEYRRGSTRAVVVGERQVDRKYTDSVPDTVEETVTVDVSTRTPNAAMRMLRDVLAHAIKPIRRYDRYQDED